MRSRPPRTMPAGQAILVALIALTLGAILNAPALSAAADSRPFGWRRTVAVVAVAPVKAVAGVLGLDRPHQTLSRVAANAMGDSATVVASAAGAPPAAPSPAADSATENPAERPTALTSARVRPSRENGRGPITDSDPLGVWIGGDSLVSEFGSALDDLLARTGRSEAQVDFRYSTGLSRPDFFDWPAQLSDVVGVDDPDAFVVMFGANDAQNLSVDGDVFNFATAEWNAEYAARVAAVMDLLTARGASVYWVGQPIMASPSFDQRMQHLNGIYRQQATGRQDVLYIDSRRLFVDDGQFAAYLVDDSGETVLMRQQDGIHLTRAGGERLAGVVLQALGRRYPAIRSE